MARPAKCRRISGYPDFWQFHPVESTDHEVILTLDEYETIRLIDLLGQTQEEAAENMQVARTTIAGIYESARKKIADALVNGKKLRISGGNYRLAEHGEVIELQEKGRETMRAAVTFANGEIFQHFGHTEQFKVYDIENGTIVKEQVIDTNGQGHGALASFLKNAEVDVLICGGIGGGAQMALNEAGIKLYAGIQGSADEAAKKLAAGTLPEHGEANCHHHGEGHQCSDHRGEGHMCTDHHEGGHGCGHHGERS